MEAVLREEAQGTNSQKHTLLYNIEGQDVKAGDVVPLEHLK